MENTRIAARSNNGCWTCRLRRKKCDEIRPVCSICSALDLECHGYGPRPEWMDNGILQREQASKFKRLVTQAKAKRAKRHQGVTNYLRQPSPFRNRSIPASSSSFVPVAAPSTSVETNICTDTFTWDNFDCSHTTFDFGSLATNTVASMAAPSPSPAHLSLSGPAPNEMFYPHGRAESTFIHPSWNVWPQDYSWPMDVNFDLDSYNPEQEVPQLPTPNSSEDSTATFHPLPTACESLEDNSCTIPMYGKDSQSSKVANGHSSTNEHSSRPHEIVDYPSPVPSLTGDTEDTLFMHYLDHVFYMQYPFYNSQNGQGRGWLLAVLRRVKAAYHASLAMSERQLLSESKDNVQSTCLSHVGSQGGHYELAIQKLQAMVQEPYTASGRGRLISLLEVLMSLLQIFSFELSNGGRERWQAHLDTAFKLIPTLLRERIPMTTALISDGHPGCTPNDQQTTLCPEVDSAFKFLTGSFLAIDILASVSTRSPLHIDPGSHVQILDSLDISVDHLIGVRNAVLSSLLDISLLDKWKKEAVAANKLSIVDLAKRGDSIQEKLRQLLAETEQHLANGSGRAQNYEKGTLDKLFLLASLTYLHVVISGAYPSVPEIADSVEETVAAFKDLRDPKLLHRVVWPFCVTGCLAGERHYDSFRGLVSRAGITRATTGSCFEALQIMETCWKARVTGAESVHGFDWHDAMKTRGCFVFLG